MLWGVSHMAVEYMSVVIVGRGGATMVPARGRAEGGLWGKRGELRGTRITCQGVLKGVTVLGG